MIGEGTMWIDIGVIVLLTLRAVLFRPTLPAQVDSTMDTLSQGVEAEQQESTLVVMEQ
jgi:hypothetical protein